MVDELLSDDRRQVRRGDDRDFAQVAALCGFPPDFLSRKPRESPAVEAAVGWLENDRPKTQNHWPALAIALLAQIDNVLVRDGMASSDDIFASHPPEVSTPGGKVVNSLNLRLKGGEYVSLRPFYNRALDVILHEMLREHPSSPGHATQSWPAYRPLITILGSMSPDERRAFSDRLWSMAVLAKAPRKISVVGARVLRPFELVLKEMPTHLKERDGGRGGALFQGIAYGYLRADSPNLILESHGVNVGSKRASMLGDVDGFRGQEPELAAEVKDLALDEGNLWSQLETFLLEIAGAPNVTAMVFCKSVSPVAREILEREGVIVLDRDDLARRVASWDVPKQQEAVRGTEYYLGRIQKSQRSVEYFRAWLSSRGIENALTTVQSSEAP